MSISFTLTFIITVVLIAGGSYFAKSFLLPGDVKALSSHEAEKETLLAPHNHNHPKHTYKLSSPLKTKISMNSEDKSKVTKTIFGQVVSHRKLQNVLLRWQLPDNAKVVSGQVEVLIPELLPHKPYEISLELESAPEENTQVHLLASTTTGSQRTSHGSQINIVAPIGSAAVDQ